MDIKLTADITLCGFVEKFHKLVTVGNLLLQQRVMYIVKQIPNRP